MENPVQVPVQIGTSVFTKALSMLRSIEKSQREKSSKTAIDSADLVKSA